MVGGVQPSSKPVLLEIHAAPTPKLFTTYRVTPHGTFLVFTKTTAITYRVTPYGNNIVFTSYLSTTHHNTILTCKNKSILLKKPNGEN